MVAPARRHLERCLALATADENLWIQSAALLDQSHVISMDGDLDSAIDAARRGAALAEHAGWSKGVAAGAANLASLHLLKGNLSAARLELQRAAEQAFPSPAFRCALNETIARLEAAAGNCGRSEELLRRCSEPSLGVPSWYRLKAAESLSKLLLGRNRSIEAHGLAEACLHDAEATGLLAFAHSFRRIQVQALRQMGRPIDWRDIPEEPLDGVQTPSDLAAVYATRALSAQPGQSDTRGIFIGAKPKDFFSVG